MGRTMGSVPEASVSTAGLLSSGAKLTIACALTVVFLLAIGGVASAEHVAAESPLRDAGSLDDAIGQNGVLYASDDGDPDPVARCSVSDTSVEVGESVTLDASASENVSDYQYDKLGGRSFGQFTAQSSRTVSYGEAGTYEPRVKGWNYNGGEESDVTNCGSVTVTEPTPTPTPTPAPSPMARCTVSDTSVAVGESVTLDASASENVDAFQYDKLGGRSFGQFTSQSSRTVSYGEVGTYEPRVKGWNYAGSEESDVSSCGSVTVTELTPTPTATPSPTQTPTPTPTAPPNASCTVSTTTVEVGDAVTLDASASLNADSYQYDADAGGNFEEFTHQTSRTVSYSEPGTYTPRVRVWNYRASEASDSTPCAQITVTDGSPTPTATPAASETGETETADGTDTERSTRDDDSTDTTTPGGASYDYEPANPSPNTTVRLTAGSAGGSDDVVAYRWDVDDDGSPELSGERITAPASSNGTATTVTLVVERADGSTEKSSMRVPIDPAGAQRAVATEMPSGTDDVDSSDSGQGIPIVWVVLVLLLVVASLGVVAVRDRFPPEGDG